MRRLGDNACIQIERHKKDFVSKYDIRIYLADDSCIDSFLKRLMKDNKIIFINGKFIKKENKKNARKK